MKNKLQSILSNYYKIQRTNNIESMLNKKNLVITILGYGLTGKSLLRWCLNNLDKTNKYFIIDKKNTAITISSNKKIIEIPESYIKICFKKSNYILPSPGFSIQKNNKWYWKIIPELDLFFYLSHKSKLESIIITGSIGKTSLSTMINHYLSKNFHTILCGNIGYPTLDALSEYKKNRKLIAIIECSNLQLQHCVLIKVDYFIITNLFNNHLDVHESYQKYILSKLSPIVFQHEYIKKIIISQSAYNELKKFYNILIKKIIKKIILILDIDNLANIKNTKKIVYIKKNMIFKNNKILLSNIPLFSFTMNWQILVTILSYYIKNIDLTITQSTLPSLPQFRLQKIKTSPSMIIYNDSKSTIIESSLSALNQILLNHNNFYIFFMIGGLSKGVNRIQGVHKIFNQVDQLILFGGESQQLYQNLLNEINTEKINSVKLFKSLFEAAKYTISTAKLIKKNSIVVFSPGGSSFDEFNSYIDRGQKFNEMITNLI
jgi:UDP-N-acetylmuramoylalanine--D-glutamate ligase